MTPDEFREALKRLGLSQVEFARSVGVHDVTARRWAAGKLEVPASVSLFLRLIIGHRLSWDDARYWIAQCDLTPATAQPRQS